MSNKKTENLNAIIRYLPEKMKNAFLNLGDKTNDLCEIRLRINGPIVLVLTDGRSFLTQSGRLTSIYGNNTMQTDAHELTTIFEKMCNYSVYSFTKNICDGFLTLENGCRVGVYGTAVLDRGKIMSVRNIKGMNIRIAGNYNGIADALLPLFTTVSANVLICGPPGSGKTTILKDLVRRLSDDMNYSIAVIDERYEFENYYLGYNTDVLSGYPKPDGIQISVRTLSPEIIVCDEIGTSTEIDSIKSGLNSGVSFVMSLHCKNMHDLMNKIQFRMLEKSEAVEYVAFLRDKSGVSEIYNIKELYDVYNRTSDDRDFCCSCGKICCVQDGCAGKHS